MRQGLMLALFFSINLILNFVATLWLKDSVYLAAAFQVMEYVLMVWIVILTYYMAKFYRDVINEGQLRYLEGFWLIASLFFFASIITAAVRLLLIFWHPEYIEAFFTPAMDFMKTVDITDAQKQQFSTAIEQLRTPVNFVLEFLWADTLIGMILALPMAFFIRKDKA